MKHVLAAGFCTIALSTPAFADDAYAPTPWVAGLGADGSVDEVGVELFSRWCTSVADDVSFGAALRAQAVGSRGLGGYLVAESAEDARGFEAGGLYRHQHGADTAITARVGVSHEVWVFHDPVADVSSSSFDDTVRLAVAPAWFDGKWFVRGDVGVDLLVRSNQMAGSAVNVAVAGGLVRGRALGGVELQTVTPTGSGFTILHAAATAAYELGRVRLFGSLGTPLALDRLGPPVIDLSVGARARF